VSQPDIDLSGVHPFSADFERWRIELAALIPGNDIVGLRALMQTMKESDAAYGTPPHVRHRRNVIAPAAPPAAAGLIATAPTSQQIEVIPSLPLGRGVDPVTPTSQHSNAHRSRGSGMVRFQAFVPNHVGRVRESGPGDRPDGLRLAYVLCCGGGLNERSTIYRRG
jgi:hypothetical protein